jgi:inner membrane protein
VRDFEHRRALAALDAVEYRGEAAKRIAAFPYMVNPFHWAGVAETSNAYVSVHVDSLRPEADPGNDAESYYKPETTDATRAACSTDLGRAYMEWARFPLVEAERLGAPGSTDAVPAAGVGGELVHFSDVRFLYPGGSRRVLEAYVLLDSHLHAKSEGFVPPKR